jgi:hypothetical protein
MRPTKGIPERRQQGNSMSLEIKGPYNIKLTRNKGFDLPQSYKTGDTFATATVMDLSGCTATFAIYSSRTEPLSANLLVTGTAVVNADLSLGSVLYSLTESQVNALAATINSEIADRPLQTNWPVGVYYIRVIRSGVTIIARSGNVTMDV